MTVTCTMQFAENICRHVVLEMKVRIIKSPKRDKKWRAIFENPPGHVDFGQKGYSDYTIHKDPARMKRYVQRHSHMGEHWGIRNGLRTAGFWSRWFLWSRPSLAGARVYIKKKFGIKVA